MVNTPNGEVTVTIVFIVEAKHDYLELGQNRA